VHTLCFSIVTKVE